MTAETLDAIQNDTLSWDESRLKIVAPAWTTNSDGQRFVRFRDADEAVIEAAIARDPKHMLKVLLHAGVPRLIIQDRIIRVMAKMDQRA
jgi:hypothetical protein